ncbi:hypothetical protein Y032_0310g2095 [Ancylostoma ceylanicum]|uniref:Uncharacterized protein n=1 Tax=Ancylostoma ceylanicum TaxID=53326 RepID=A0A016S284_9BILA|nr:hypothetical protein Y032_0310g2095 [Ancylostoma ceylanicum]
MHPSVEFKAISGLFRGIKLLEAHLLFLSFAGLFIAGVFIFKVNDYSTTGFMTIRDKVISNYSEILFINQRNNISVYDLLVSIDTTMREMSQPKLDGTRMDPVAVLNMMFGIKMNFATSDQLLINIYFFVANLVISLIVVCLCYIFDRKFNERFASEWSLVTCPPRDIVLEYKQQLERGEATDGKRRVCTMANPLPKDLDKSLFLHPVSYPRPAIKLLLIFMLYSMFMATVIALMKRSSFSQEYFALLNFSAGIAQQIQLGNVWDYFIWFISLFGVVLYKYTMYSLTLIVIDLICAIVCIRERVTPILID